jgi:hypothetical protein
MSSNIRWRWVVSRARSRFPERLGQKKLNARADADDLVGITKRVNGGANGLNERGAIVARAKVFLGIN